MNATAIGFASSATRLNNTRCGVAELFTVDGVYHDAFFYGAFAGPRENRQPDRRLVLSHRNGFSGWDMHAPVSDGHTLYARYIFSYRSTLPEAKGARAMFEGRRDHEAPRRQDSRISRRSPNTATGFVRYELRA